jgi:segregation and condensation protein B
MSEDLLTPPLPEKTPAEVKKPLEALIFLAPEGVTARRLAEVLECQVHVVQKAAEELARDYQARDAGLQILPVAGGYQLVTARDLAEVVERYLTVIRKRGLSKKAMETLAIVAYRQPITRPEIEAIRGVDSGSIITGLLEKKLIRLAGRKKAPGKPLMYATTREFLLHFGLRDLRELPALAEFGRQGGEEEILPLEEVSVADGASDAGGE